jgi:hypothetical protein
MNTKEMADNLSPLSWALDCSKIRNTFGIKQHPWRAGLTGAVRRALTVLNAEDSAVVAQIEKEENEDSME